MSDMCERCEKILFMITPHRCPYAVDIYDDTDTLCNCCQDCEEDCAMDI